MELGESVRAVIEGLLSTALWNTSSRLSRSMSAAADSRATDLLFTADTLDTSSVAALAIDLLASLPSDGLTSADLTQLLESPDILTLVHEFLALRLLECSAADCARVADGLQAQVANMFPELTSEAVQSASHVIYDALDAAISGVVVAVDAAAPAVRDRIRALAGLNILTAAVQSIERHVASLVARATEDNVRLQEYEARYRTQMIRRHGVIELPDLEEERRVAIERLYVEPTIEVADQASPTSSAKLLDTSTRVVVLGNPGAGKSTLARVLAYRTSQSGIAIPLFVSLHDYGRDFAAGRSIVDHIERELRTQYQAPPPAAWLESVLLGGRAIVFFDGLDELLDTTERRAIRDAVEQFCYVYPFTSVVVTSRVVGYQQAPLPNEFTVATLGQLRTEGVREYVAKWFTVVEGQHSTPNMKYRVDRFMHESESVDDLRVNPLLLSLMCVLYRGSGFIPESRLSLYEECARLLFKRWDRSRGIEVPLQIGSDIDPALMNLAYWMLTGGHAQSGVTEGSLISASAQFMVPRRFEDIDDARRAAEEFVGFCRGRAWVLADAGTEASGERRYTFTHRTFMEYYAAHHLARKAGDPAAVADELAPRLAHAEWDVVAQLALQIVDKNFDRGADKALARLIELNGRNDFEERAKVLSFIARVTQILTPSPEMVRRVVQECFAHDVLNEQHAPMAEDVGLQNVSMSFVMAASRSNRATVVNELTALVQPHISGATRSSEGDRVLAFVCWARQTVADHGTSMAGEDLYPLWGSWSEEMLADVNVSGAPLAPVLSLWIGATETALISVREFLTRFPLAALWSSAPHPLGVLSRTGTLPLLAGWIGGYYRDRVFLPGAAPGLLRQLRDLILDAPDALRMRNTDAALHGRFQKSNEAVQRVAGLDDPALEGAALVLTMESEAEFLGRRYASRSTIQDSRGLFTYVDQLERVRNGEGTVGDVEQAGWVSDEVHELLSLWAVGEFKFFEFD